MFKKLIFLNLKSIDDKKALRRSLEFSANTTIDYSNSCNKFSCLLIDLTKIASVYILASPHIILSLKKREFFLLIA